MGAIMIKKRYFTLIEMLFSIVILIALIGISWVAGNKVLKSQNKTKIKAEVAMIEAAIHKYKDRYNEYPFTETQIINFAEKLSSVPSNAGWEGSVRPMFIDFKSNNMMTNNDNYNSSDPSEATATTLFDPYESPYRVIVILNDKGKIIKFTVVSTSDIF